MPSSSTSATASGVRSTCSSNGAVMSRWPMSGARYGVEAGAGSGRVRRRRTADARPSAHRARSPGGSAGAGTFGPSTRRAGRRRSPWCSRRTGVAVRRQEDRHVDGRHGRRIRPRRQAATDSAQRGAKGGRRIGPVTRRRGDRLPRAVDETGTPHRAARRQPSNQDGRADPQAGELVHACGLRQVAQPARQLGRDRDRADALWRALAAAEHGCSSGAGAVCVLSQRKASGPRESPFPVTARSMTPSVASVLERHSW